MGWAPSSSSSSSTRTSPLLSTRNEELGPTIPTAQLSAVSLSSSFVTKRASDHATQQICFPHLSLSDSFAQSSNHVLDQLSFGSVRKSLISGNSSQTGEHKSKKNVILLLQICLGSLRPSSNRLSMIVVKISRRTSFKNVRSRRVHTRHQQSHTVRTFSISLRVMLKRELENYFRQQQKQ